jgi:hypothetical protein
MVVSIFRQPSQKQVRRAMPYVPSDKFEVRQLPGRGNGVLATQPIAKGDALFTEHPLTWHRIRHADAATEAAVSRGVCDHCGRWVTEDDTIFEGSHDGPPQLQCDGGCGVSYCGHACRDAASDSHHRTLCPCFKARDSAVARALLPENDPDGHIGCAIKITAVVAQALEATAGADCADQGAVDAAVEKVLGQWHNVRWTKMNHHFRGMPCTLAPT